MSCVGKLLSADDKIDALDNKLVIFLLRTLTWRTRFAHKVIWKRNPLHVEIDVWMNKAVLVEHVYVRLTDKHNHGTFRECRGSSVQTDIVFNDCGNT